MLKCMARPLRLEFAGALYHVTSRGDGQEAIYRAEGDRRMFLEVLAAVRERFNWTVHAYCLMTNHLLVETPDANLSKVMCAKTPNATTRLSPLIEAVATRCWEIIRLPGARVSGPWGFKRWLESLSFR